MPRETPLLLLVLAEPHRDLSDYLADIGYRVMEAEGIESAELPAEVPRVIVTSMELRIPAATPWLERLREGLVGVIALGESLVMLADGPLRPDARLALDTTGRELATAIRLLDELVAVRFSNREEREECQRWMTLAMRDPLTHLPNRRAWDLSLAEHLARPGTLCVAMLDVDFFKQINDGAGYHVGDGVLREIAQVIRSRLRAEDVVGRLGGDEFGVILRGVNRRTATAVLERLRFEVTQHLRSQNLPAATLSAGFVVVQRQRRGNSQDVYAAAAVSLQAAKQHLRTGGIPLLPKPQNQ